MKKNNVPTCAPRTAVAYARYSSAGQRDVSIEQQLADIRAFAKRSGFTIVHEYADHAKSGFKNANARTAFQSMMAAAGDGNFDSVICWKVDRFGRNREESALFKGRLRRFGVKVFYAMEPIPEGSAGVLLEGMLEATAEWYSRQLSENVIRGMTDNANKCMYNGTHILGYRSGPDGRYVIQEEEAAVVRDIFTFYRGGYSAARIAKDLNARGLLTSRRNPYTAQGILKILSNERYTGVYIWGRFRTPGGMPAIVTPEEFEEAQRMKKKTARHVEQGVTDYLLTGKAFCGLCGCSMVGDSGTSKLGNRYYYYSCLHRKRDKACTKKSVSKDLLEETVVSFVLDHVLSDAEIGKIADAVMALQAEEMKRSPLAAMEAEHSEVTKKIDNINNAIAAGIWNSSTSVMLKELEDEAETLRVSIETLRYSQAQLVDRDRVLFFLHRFTSGDRNDPLLRRSIIETFINSVYVYDDHLKIIINNVEGNERIPFSDLPPECSEENNSGLPTVSHPNPRITIYRIAM